MDTSDYWALIERSGTGATDLDSRAKWLANELARMPPADIVQFRLRHAEVKKAADTWPMWGAAYLINEGWCSDDVFWYFQSWLISLGRETYERVTTDPDALAEVHAVQRLASGEDTEWPEWEVLDYVAVDAYHQATGQEDGLDHILAERGIMLPVVPEPTDDDLDEGQAAHARRLTLLSHLFAPADTG